ncbi:histidine phosphatase family protein [Wenzhouxiangella sp. AB-CW3]|uniref:SixA phosphatase family protein n=1 Tax=Wenzhouxiangella sp. AB-CW3 TaxID=2771012 RepID=UPI00168A9CFE|nr:histidine phosphatase family protein [Wenzhouxiangella sp. AB-CW3]QOC21850.1 histidine phosphatase family protein [Wenzhouxiangella sp. AB-CW3]
MELWILRHAKARAPLADEYDQDRPLTEQGQADAVALNRWLARQAMRPPGRILVSPAARTRQTADLVLRDLDAPAPLIEPQLWEAGDRELIGLLQADPQQDSMMLIGHNPGLEWLTRWITGQRLTLGLQPGTLVVIDTPDPTAPGSGSIKTVRQPTDLT